MNKFQFKTVVNASREKVWEILWGENTYPQWTAPFCEGSKAITDWKEGSKVLFVDGASGDGMVSRIETNRPNEFMSIEHLGMIKDGVEDTSSEKVKDFAGAHENYTLKTIDGKTEVTIDMDIAADYTDFFNKTWPLALELVKELAEQ